jgi:hypothetical protein
MPWRVEEHEIAIGPNKARVTQQQRMPIDDMFRLP